MRQPHDATRSLLCPHPVPAPAMRVFLLHHAGGSHLLFRDWSRYFPRDWEVCFLEAPGRGRLSHLLPRHRAADVVSFFLEDICPRLDRPFAVFGHSMGALLAYEMTLHLLGQGGPLPVWLGLSARAAPRPDGGLDVRNRHLMPPEELRRAVAEMGGTPRELLADPEWWALFEPVLRSDLRLVETWRPRPGTARIPLPVSVFGGERDVVVRPERLADWADHVEQYMGLRLYPGDHFYFHNRESLLVDQIIADIRAADGMVAGGRRRWEGFQSR
ncbi:thioesterase II family protein [Salinactinospora qingdaonensis]|uniref:Alpha/beta fold hydrolase n=1 Tax=Salinactinospora qingdaonensis TaxID=702744 RepID=A0ABP7G6H8_9ACTN